MKAMRANVKYLSMVGICSQGSSHLTSELWKTLRACIIIAVFVGSFLSGSLVFTLQHLNDLEEQQTHM